MQLARTAQVQRFVAANIRRLRARQDITQEELAEKASLGAVHVRSIERGVENVTLATLVAIADALGVAPGLLLRRATLPPLRPGRPRTRLATRLGLKR
jgi:transcriptional regulator with XRE-family HTH domain